MKHIIAIDPGKSKGGIAYWDLARHGPTAMKMPATERDLWNLMYDLAAEWEGSYDPSADRPTAIIERLGAMPRDKVTGKAKQSPGSMFKQGVNYGLLRMALIGNNIPFTEVLPVVWQRSMGLVRSGANETPTQKKNRHKQMAQQLFPDLKVTHATADALLLCEYLRRLERKDGE